MSRLSNVAAADNPGSRPERTSAALTPERSLRFIQRTVQRKERVATLEDRVVPGLVFAPLLRFETTSVS